MGDLTIRRSTPADEDEMLALLAASLGWVPDDQHRDFFRWKHVENPFGASPVWLAVDGDRLAGVRVLLRWRFRLGASGVKHAVRAVDTATHPDFQGQGIFTKLTMSAVDELTADGVDFVFNTPNDQSRPGYVKMGWSVLGRVPIGMRPRGPASMVRMTRSRVAADKWGQGTDAFHDPAEVFADADALDALLASRPPTSRLCTDRSVGYLRWRYGFEGLHYRVAVAPGGVTDGVVVFRLRRRGGAVEAAICELLAPPGGDGGLRRLVRDVLRATGADYAVAASPSVRHGIVPLPRLGPIFTRRPLADPAVGSLADFDLALGDVELF